MKIADAKKLALARLKNISTTAFLDVDILLQKTLQVERSFIFANPEKLLTIAQQNIFLQQLSRRERGEPMAYIIGTQAFYHLNFSVNRQVLIPRPETELLVDLILSTFCPDENLKLLDLGCGSGVIAISLAHTRQNWQVTALDCSKQALQLAQQNAKCHQVNNIRFLHGDWFTPLLAEEKFDCIVSNPPYLSVDDVHLSALAYEPKVALVAANDGLAAFQQIIQQAPKYLKSKAYLFLEHGATQHQAVAALLAQSGLQGIQLQRDFAGHPRVTYAQLDAD